MCERLQFDLIASQTAGHRLAVTVPNVILDKVIKDPQLGRLIKELTSKRINAVAVENGQVSSQLFINDKRLGSSTARERLVNNVLKIVTAFDLLAEPNQEDPDFRAQIGTTPVHATGRYLHHQQVAWPELNETSVAQNTTDLMRATATKLKYDHKSMIPELVYAQVFRDRFVTLQTNDMGSCAFDTDAGVYDPEAPQFELFGHNIYTPVQQFIGLVGGVAIARADQLASE